MEYCKDTTKEYLLAIAENIAGTMLVDEDGEYKNVTPFNCHMLFLCIGTYITVDMNRTDILRLNSFIICLFFLVSDYPIFHMQT